eukprot:CAMPEP_0195540514 /NCGR_PEP_ID=MMETSP0794_2-20130614/50611_1 /TAXON_ID=515487 /ORGANISM="Stephanopyxis turris, Strain CCMP 815" /LENGTH=136 /DNA_ID=CAMNT_0040674583 /DNA_START=278 /DNA_END=690 /DNA_ORIENTATION=+
MEDERIKQQEEDNSDGSFDENNDEDDGNDDGKESNSVSEDEHGVMENATSHRKALDETNEDNNVDGITCLSLSNDEVRIRNDAVVERKKQWQERIKQQRNNVIGISYNTAAAEREAPQHLTQEKMKQEQEEANIRA